MKRIIITIFLLLCIMFAEYRCIMLYLNPYYGDHGTLYIEFLGMVDTYYAAPVTEME